MEEDPITGPAIGLIVAGVLCMLLAFCCFDNNPGGSVYLNGLLVSDKKRIGVAGCVWQCVAVYILQGGMFCS